MAASQPLDTQSLLPPLLACLPTAFASPKPPPALLPLLSPILSQRVQLLSESTNRSSWLPLLNWDDHEADQLSKIVENADLEPHPVSGEVEIGEPEPSKYRRLDEETLQGLVNLLDIGLAIVYVWSTAEGTQAWRVAEVKPTGGSGSGNPTPWEPSIAAAEDAFESKTHASEDIGAAAGQETGQGAAEEEEDDDYWAQYDAMPGRTPAKQSPAPAMASNPIRHPATADDSYWSQYAQVQPAMDNDDPDERTANAEHLGESELDGNALLKAAWAAQQSGASEETTTQSRSLYTPGGSKNTEDSKQEALPVRSLFTPNGTSNAGVGTFTVFPPTAPETRHSPMDTLHEHIQHPRPRSAQSSNSSHGSSRVVEHLEEQAERSGSPAEFAIQQHISTSMKSLYRLSRGAGMERAEFERIVKAELDVLSMMDDN